MDTSKSENAVQYQWPVPVDLGLAGLLVVIADVLLLEFASRLEPLRTVFTFVLVTFVPGYVLIATLFPRRSSGAVERRTINWKERSALSFGTSLALLPIFGLVVAMLTGSLSREPMLFGLNAFVLVCLVAGSARRHRLPGSARFRVPYRQWIQGVRRSVASEGSRLDRAVALFVIMSVLAAVVTMGYVLAVPNDGESYSDLYLATENESGQPVTNSYPTTFTAGTPRELVVGIRNHEQTRTEYTVVATLQRVEILNGTATVLEREKLKRFDTTLKAGGSWSRPHEIAPAMTGTDLRLVYSLYRGDRAVEPAAEEPYRRTYLWVNVTAPDDD